MVSAVFMVARSPSGTYRHLFQPVAYDPARAPHGRDLDPFRDQLLDEAEEECWEALDDLGLTDKDVVLRTRRDWAYAL